METVSCKWCTEEISNKALVCKGCSRHQHVWLAGFVQYSGALISVVLMVVALIQLSYASRDRESSEVALAEAQLALTAANTARTAADTAKAEANTAKAAADDALSQASSAGREASRAIDIALQVTASADSALEDFRIMTTLSNQRIENIDRQLQQAVLSTEDSLCRASYNNLLTSYGIYKGLPVNGNTDRYGTESSAITTRVRSNSSALQQTVFDCYFNKAEREELLLLARKSKAKIKLPDSEEIKSLANQKLKLSPD